MTHAVKVGPARLVFTSALPTSRPRISAIGLTSRLTVPVVIGEYRQQRMVPRKLLRLPAWIVFYRASLKKHVAMVRDMTRQGVFFYSDFRPAVGDQIEVRVEVLELDQHARVACKGKVLRVEQPAPDARTGY